MRVVIEVSPADELFNCDLYAVDEYAKPSLEWLFYMREKTLVVLGARVREIREARGLSQEALAELANLDRTYVSGLERGVRNPTIMSLARIATALGATLEELCKGVKQ
jgi:DNA-binding XRE family transcriptional regulator